MSELESNLPKMARHGGGSSPQDMPYTEEELARINAEFDARMGWHPGASPVFSNPMRLHESHVGPAETAWEKRT